MRRTDLRLILSYLTPSDRRVLRLNQLLTNMLLVSLNVLLRLCEVISVAVPDPQGGTATHLDLYRVSSFIWKRAFCLTEAALAVLCSVSCTIFASESLLPSLLLPLAVSRIKQ